jgi:stage II sporulation protein D
VTYGGQPVATYYFSASGGHTENVENSFLGADPKPWLKGVDDPYDVISPRHRWRVSFSTAQIDARLGSYSPGRFRKIVVLRRGVSPRIVRARVYGTQGTREISGPALRSRLGLYDTWAYFNTVSTSQVGSPTAFSARLGDVFPRRRIRGSFAPAPRGRLLTLERRAGSAWVRVKAVRTSASGRYTAVVPASGVYRVRAGDVAGPAVRVR